MNEAIFKELMARWPSPLIFRTETKLAGGGLCAKSMSNLDSLGKGPAVRIRVGGKVAYPIKDFVEWLEARSAVIADRKKGEIRR